MAVVESANQGYDENDPVYQQTIRDAQETLPEFRALLRLPGEANALVCVKTRLTDGAVSALVWLLLIKSTPEGFFASVFEIPPGFATIQIGDRFEIASEAVVDWMYNMGGIVHGGFSIRYLRDQLSPEHQATLDERVGATQYV